MVKRFGWMGLFGWRRDKPGNRTGDVIATNV
jgi:hypothetical protein